MTYVRGNPQRTQRKDVITEAEFNEMLREAEAIPETFYRLRTTALLCILRLTGKRRSEVARLELTDFKVENDFLHVTFTLSKKRRQNVMTKRSQKSIPLSDPLTRPILDYLDYLKSLDPTPKFYFPQTKSLWGQGYAILGDKAITGRQVFNLVRAVTEKAWCHLFRETAASDVVKSDPSIIGAFKVQRRLDLESVQTGFNYVRRFASDIITREIEQEAF
ncbi:site-specific integrase [Candidatus Bathyarchaeota archaeon A05DMB-2]|jgi:integrase|nr:site-specific integrase [Candidatus Bathyarchaeota archaeon A05DMB-2]